MPSISSPELRISRAWWIANAQARVWSRPGTTVLALDENIDQLNPTGTKGSGEIGMCGSAAAIVNAIWHATGVRVRDLPVRLDRFPPAVPTDQAAARRAAR